LCTLPRLDLAQAKIATTVHEYGPWKTEIALRQPTAERTAANPEPLPDLTGRQQSFLVPERWVVARWFKVGHARIIDEN